MATTSPRWPQRTGGDLLWRPADCSEWQHTLMRRLVQAALRHSDSIDADGLRRPVSSAGPFLTGYREAVASGGEQASIAVKVELLDLFSVEKAAYEVVHEVANRSIWINAPLHGLARRTRLLLRIEVSHD